MKIDGKQFMNLQEAVGWLLENNALPFQSTNVFVGDTEISKATIINPSPAQIRVGALVLFSDGKVGTVSAITSNGFMVNSNYTDLANIAKYITAVTVDASGHLIVTLSDGSSVDAGILKQISSFAMSGTDLIAYYNDGTSYNCGPIFVGSLTLPADLTVTDDLSVGGDSSFTGPATFDGNVTLSAGKNLTVGGNANLQTADFYDLATFYDEAHFDSRVTFYDDVSIGGNLTVTGTTTLNDDLTLVNSSIYADDANLAGDLAVTNSASIGGNLTVTGSINGEANPSLKPIYCHPILLYKSSEKNRAMMLIFNNSDTPFTRDTLFDYIVNNASFRGLLNGIISGAQTVYIVRNSAYEVGIIYVDASQTSGVNSLAFNKTQFLNAFTAIDDTVHKIN